MTAIGRPVPGTTAELPATAKRRTVRFHWLPFLFGVLLATAGVAVAVGAFLYSFGRQYDGRVVAGVSVAGVPVGGLDPAAAEARLRASLPALDRGEIRVVLEGDHDVVIPYAALGREFRIEEALAEAFAVGRSGQPIEALGEQLATMSSGWDVPVAIEYERDTLQRRLRLAAATYATRGQNAAVMRSRESLGYVVRPATDGRRVDPEPLIAAVGDRLGTADPASITLQATPIPIGKRITTEHAQAAAARANALVAAPLEMTDGNETWTVSQKQLRNWISFGETDTEKYGVRFDSDALAALVAGLEDEVHRDVRNPITVGDGVRVIGFTGGVEGRDLNVDESIARVQAALDARLAGGAPEGNPVELAVTVTKPQTSGGGNGDAVVVQRLSQWTTYYQPSEKNFFGTNISLPTARINGTIVGPGEWFDFLAHAGPLTRANGYGPGGFIRNGRTDPTGAIAGGICSCSTTLFNAAVRAGLEIGMRDNHSYYITRYPLGLDATVSTSNGQVVQNMTFRNDTGAPILIRSYNAYGATTFEIWGVPTGRTVSFSAPYVTNRQPAGDRVEYTSALPTGVRKRIEYPAAGMNVTVTRTVRAADGTVLHHDTFVSNYRRVDGITLVGR